MYTYCLVGGVMLIVLPKVDANSPGKDFNINNI